MEHNKTNVEISYSDEDLSDQEDAVITNIDEFCTINELQINTPKEVNNNNIKLNKITKIKTNKAESLKINEPFKISTPIQNMSNDNMNLYSLLINGDNNIVKKKPIRKKLKMKKKSLKKANNFNDLNIKNFLDIPKKNGKSVFIKISEDIYTKLKSKPNKEVRDIYKTEEDAYNKMTSDPYILNCENKENIKNKKIVQQCLDRKAKEDIFKKIGIECDRNTEKKKLQDPKRACSVTDRNNNLKSTRTLAQFLRDQNGDRKKEKRFNKKNKKFIPLPIKGNILPQDSTFIFSENKADLNSQFSDFSNNFLDYESESKSMFQNNEKYIINQEEEKYDMNNSKINKTFQLGKDAINSSDFSLISDTENNKQKNNKNIRNNLLYNKSKNQKKNIKDLSTNSVSKNSLENNTKKFLSLYKEIIESYFGQNIESNFEVNFSYFLLILYKLGFINRNYSTLIESSYEVDTKKMGTMHPSVISDISISNSSLPIKQINPGNKRNNQIIKNSLGGKSLEDEGENYTINSFKNEKEFILSKDAWKILTEKKNFDDEISVNSNKIFLFFICVLGIGDYIKGKNLLKKDYDFFFKNKKLVTQFNNMKKYINKYFEVFATNASDNSINSEKRKKIIESNLNSYTNSHFESIDTSLVLNNSDLNNKYNIYGKNYDKIRNLDDNFDDINSIQLFNEEIKRNDKFYYSISKRSDKSSKTLNLTDLTNIDNKGHNLLNSSLTDNSSILDLKKLLNPNNSEKMEEEIEVDSFLFEDNNKKFFKYNNNDINNKKNKRINKPEKEKTKKNIINKTNKRIGYVFEIKVEKEMKKLILKKGQDKNLVVKNFCEKYNINDEEKNKILKIIDERIKHYSIY